jgi:putative transcriptional regulator
MLEALKKAGYTTYRIRKDKIMGEAALNHLRQGESISFQTMDTICKILNCQPGDMLEYVSD